MPREKPLHEYVMKFCREHLGKTCFAPFTGQDWSAWVAFCYLVELYSRGDSVGRSHAIRAMHHALHGAQCIRANHQLFIQIIPAVLEWSDAAQLWPQLGSPYSDMRPRNASEKN